MHCLLLVLIRDFRKEGGVLSDGGSGELGNTTGVSNLRFCLLFALKFKQFVPENCGYSIVDKENHHEEDLFMQL